LNDALEAKNSLKSEVLIQEKENSEIFEKEVKPVDLFSGVSKSEKNKVQSTGNQVIKHTLVDQKEQEEESAADQESYTLREAVSEFSFGIPVSNYGQEDAAHIDQELVEEPEMEFNPDENKTDETIEEQLKKAKERIL